MPGSVPSEDEEVPVHVMIDGVPVTPTEPSVQPTPPTPPPLAVQYTRPVAPHTDHDKDIDVEEDEEDESEEALPPARPVHRTSPQPIPPAAAATASRPAAARVEPLAMSELNASRRPSQSTPRREGGGSPRFLSSSGNSPRGSLTPRRVEKLALPIGPDGQPFEPRQPNYGRVLNFSAEEERDRERRERALHTPRKTKKDSPRCTVPVQDPYLERLAQPRRRSSADDGAAATAGGAGAITTPRNTSRLATPRSSVANNPRPSAPRPVTTSQPSSYTNRPTRSSTSRSPGPASARASAPRPYPTGVSHVGYSGMERISRLAQPRQQAPPVHRDPYSPPVAAKPHSRRYGGTTMITPQPLSQSKRAGVEGQGQGTASPRPQLSWADLPPPPPRRPASGRVTAHGPPPPSQQQQPTAAAQAQAKAKPPAEVQQVRSVPAQTAAPTAAAAAAPEAPRPPPEVKTRRFVPKDEVPEVDFLGGAEGPAKPPTEPAPAATPAAGGVAEPDRVVYAGKRRSLVANTTPPPSGNGAAVGGASQPPPPVAAQPRSVPITLAARRVRPATDATPSASAVPPVAASAAVPTTTEHHHPTDGPRSAPVVVRHRPPPQPSA